MARKGRGRDKQAKWDRGALRPSTVVSVNIVTEADSALSIGHKRFRLVGTVIESDEANIVGSGDIFPALEADSSRPITRLKKRTIAIITRTHSALDITFRKTVAVNIETDTSLTIIPYKAPPIVPPVVSIWRVELWPLNGAAKLINVPVQSWMFNYVLNGPGAFEADIQLNHTLATETNFSVGAREIRVYRSNALVWGGYLWGLTASATEYKLKLRGEGYFSRLRRRLIASDLVKKQRDQADIAWDLIQYTQSTHGTFNITDAHVNTGIKIDHAYCATDLGEVGSAIEELSEMDDSFDFWITPTIAEATNKVFRNASPRRGATKSVTINQNNALSADYEIDATDLSNRIWGVGAGDCNPPSFEANAAASITTYGELHETIQYDDLDHLPSVKAHTREELRVNKQPRRQVTVRLEERDYTWGDFDVGDIITLASNRGYLNDSRQMRVIRIQINFDPENRIGFYEMDLDSVIA